MNLKCIIKRPNWLGQVLQSSHKSQQLEGKENLLCEGGSGYGHGPGISICLETKKQRMIEMSVGRFIEEACGTTGMQFLHPGDMEIGSEPQENLMGGAWEYKLKQWTSGVKCQAGGIWVLELD